MIGMHHLRHAVEQLPTLPRNHAPLPRRQQRLQIVTPSVEKDQLKLKRLILYRECL